MKRTPKIERTYAVSTVARLSLISDPLVIWTGEIDAMTAVVHRHRVESSADVLVVDWAGTKNQSSVCEQLCKDMMVVPNIPIARAILVCLVACGAANRWNGVCD